MNKKDKMKIKYSLSALLSNNRFLIVCSFIIAFVLWMWVAIEQSPQDQRVIKDVPVKIRYEDSIPEKMGLQIFGQSEFTVDITVTGKKYIVSSLEAEDFTAVANTDSVVGSGQSNLKIYVSANESNADYTITNYSYDSIDVFFDKFQEIEMPISVNVISRIDNIVPENHKLGTPYLSSDKLTISGPASVVNKIEAVNADVVIDSVLTQSTNKDVEISIKTSDNADIDKSLLTFNETNVTVTLPVLKIVTLPTVIEFKNAPAYLINNTLPFQVYPSTVKAAVPVEDISTTENYVVAVIDFADIYNKKNIYQIDVASTKSYEIFDDTIDSFSVTVDASQMVTKTVSVPSSNISIKNNNTNHNISFATDASKSVTLIGDVNSIESVTGSDVYIVVDVSKQAVTTDTKVLKGTVTISSNKKCWAVGECNLNVVVN